MKGPLLNHINTLKFGVVIGVHTRGRMSWFFL